MTVFAPGGPPVTAGQGGGNPGLSQQFPGALSQFVTPEQFGAKGNGINDDTAAIQTAMAQSAPLVLAGVTYLVSAAIAIPAGKTIWSLGATLLHQTTTLSTLVVADGVNDWKIIGDLTIKGAGNAVGTAKALDITGSNRYQVEQLTLLDVSGWGIYIKPGTFVTPGGQGQFNNCLAYNCYIGVEGVVGTGAEYATFSNFNALTCTTAIIIAAGNYGFVGGNVLYCTNGILINNGSNHAHGLIVGMQINHSVNYSVKLVAVTNGFTFSGCHFFANDGVSGFIWLVSSQGLNICGGIVDAPVKNDTPVGYSQIVGAMTPDLADVIITDASARMLIHGAFTPTGGFSDAPNQVTSIAPALLNSWVNFGAPTKAAGYYQDANGITHLEGVIKSGTATANTVLFTLPAGYRPAARQIFAVASNDLFGAVQVSVNGDVQILAGSNVYLALDTVAFISGA